ncbi:flavonol 4'-sulfotransferase-like [Pyrus ussuriensis x Pyrus communis]|uniref:Sulfotransferase n=1 Tax=Pyrus ussuriensis x Pyrus communis TaxID=2448454 RepID=A0A5N5I3W0_9ROSA|nr:flavonol 4'-sulfotransferase-like [Pyrus ussuriensis x Pyrus communis]
MSSASTSQPIVPKTDYIEEKEDEEAYWKIDAEICGMLPNLPKEKGWTSEDLVQYQGFWIYPTFALKAAVHLQHHFNLFQTTGSSTSAARGSLPMYFLATLPKSGTTWLRALMFATLNRSLYDAASPHHPLLTTGPHDCFPCLEMDNMLGNHDHSRPVTSLDHDHHDDRDGGDAMIDSYVPPTSTAQLFATHLPYSLFPKSVTTSSSNYGVSKFVYVCRNPKDVFISLWKFGSKVKAVNTGLAPFSLEEAFDLFCRGVCPYGPYWDHVLGFWKASLEMPEQVLFLKYEYLRKEPSANVKRLAEFLGQPFSEEEESKGVVQQIIKLCSFENLSSLEINKTSRTQQYLVKANIVVENSDFFRKGQVGDWKNFFTDDMAKRMDHIIDERFSGSGLTFANP